MLTFVPLVLAILGVLLISLGTYMSFSDWNAKRKAEAKAKAGLGAAVDVKLGAAEGIDAITKFAEAIKGYPLGMQIILVGVLLEVIASFWGGVGMLAGK